MISLAGAPPRLRLLVVAICTMPASAGAADWTVQPSLRLRESYSDNIHLTPQAQASGEYTSEISPAIALTATGARLSLRLDYALQQQHYAHQPDRLSHLLDSNGHGELVQDWLFLDGHAAISQQNISAFGPQLTDSRQDNPNRGTVRTASLSPYLLHRFRDVASAELRYAYNAMRSDGLLDAHSSDLSLKLVSDNGGRGWQWEANLDRNETADSTLAPVIRRDASLTLRVPLTGRLSAFATAGHEEEGYRAAGAQPAGRYWSLGGGWTPSPRTSVSASVGRRYFGRTTSLDAQYHMRNTIWSLSYGEDITTSYAQFLRLQPDGLASFLYQLWGTRIPDPDVRRQTVNAFLRLSQMLGPYAGNVNYFSHRYFLQKQWTLSSAYSGARSTLAFSLASTDRTAQTNSAIDSPLLPPDQLALNEHTRQRSAQAGWNWRISQRSSANLSASLAQVSSVDTGRRDRNSGMTLGLSHQLQPKLSATLDLHHTRHRSNAGGDYRENGISAALQLLF